MLGLCSQIHGYWYLLDFVGLVPWLLALDTARSAVSAACSGLTMCVAFVATIFAWFGIAVANYSGSSTALTTLLLVCTAPLLQPQFLTFALVRYYAGNAYGPALRAVAGACAWVATEWLFPKLLGDTLAHGLYPSPILRQCADLGGTAGITLLLVIVNECVATALARRHRGASAVLPPLLQAGSIVAVMCAYGAARLSAVGAMVDDASEHVRIGIVQSNIVSYERLRREMGAYDVVRYILDTHFFLSRTAVDLQRVDALLWSETVYPTTFAQPKSDAGGDFDREITEFVASVGVPLVFGTYDRDAHGEYNAAVLVEPRPAPLQIYRKANLFFLTEYVPRWLEGPTIRSWLPWAGTWQPGRGPKVLQLRLADGREISVLPMICLDDVDTSLAIAGARLGARLILTMSNDSWFSEHLSGAHLHLVVSAFRSIETGMPQVRVTANGISAVIDSTGTIRAAAGVGERRLVIGDIVARVPVGTLIVAWGDWVGRASLGILFLLASAHLVGCLRMKAEARS